MKFIIFVFTVFFMLTVTLQESLAQASTKAETKEANKNIDAETEEFIKKFTNDPENFYPQSAVKNVGINQTEGDDGFVDPALADSSQRLNVSIDRHTNTAYKNASNKNTVRDAIGGGSKTESER